MISLPAPVLGQPVPYILAFSILLPAIMGFLGMPDYKAVARSTCLGILIAIGIVVLELYLDDMPRAEELKYVLILHAGILELGTYMIAFVALSTAAGCIAGLGLIWGRKLQKQIGKK